MTPEPASLATATEEEATLVQALQRIASLEAVVARAHSQATAIRLLCEVTPGAAAEAAGANLGLLLATLEAA